MKRITLNAKERKGINRDGKIPAVIYGAKVKNTPLEVSYGDFEKVYREAGENSLVDLDMGQDKPVTVLIHEVQADAVTDKFMHVDFLAVRMDKKIKAEIPIELTGVAPAVHEQGGVLVHSIDSLEVESLPGDLPKVFEIDLSRLKEIGDFIHVSDIEVPENVEILSDKEQILVSVVESRIQEEEEITPTKEEGEGEAEGEEPAEGAEGEVKEGEASKTEEAGQGEEKKS